MRWRLRTVASAATLVILSLSAYSCTTSGGGPSETATVSGQATYRERIALPPTAVAVFAVVEVDGGGAVVRTVAEERVEPAGQVPIRFALTYARTEVDTARRYALLVRIDDGAGRVLFHTRAPVTLQPLSGATVDVLLQSAAGASPEGDAGGTGATAEYGSAEYACEALRFTVVYPSPDTMRMMLVDDTVELYAVRTASGARYRNERIDFWSRGDEATVVVDDRTVRCRVATAANDPWERARAEGVDFRAIGQEPGWFLELKEGESVLLVTAYGESTDTFERPTRSVVGEVVLYEASDGDRSVAISVEARPCNDGMSGEAFPFAVTVVLNGEQHQGCGRRLS